MTTTTTKGKARAFLYRQTAHKSSITQAFYRSHQEETSHEDEDPAEKTSLNSAVRVRLILFDGEYREREIAIDFSLVPSLEAA